MPDWFYRTVSQPLLFRLPAVQARNLALRFMSTLARTPFGPALIDLLGHMRPDARLRRTFLGITFPSAVGLGASLDSAAIALPALARFGVGFLDVGPLTVAARAESPPPQRRPELEAIWYPQPPWGPHLAMVLPRAVEAAKLSVPLLARLGRGPGTDALAITEECRHLIRELSPHVSLFALATLSAARAAGWSETQWREHVESVVTAARSATSPRPVLLGLSADLDAEKCDPLLTAAHEAGVQGFLVDGSVSAEPDGCLVGVPARAPALALVRQLRQRFGTDVLLIASGGVHEPADALELRAAGADLVEVDSGLVYSGPGLPKRINDAFLFVETYAQPEEPPQRPAEMAWLWTTLLGLGMFLGSLLALAIASTRVVLPYDESFSHKSREELTAINPRLLAFLAHDRVSLAGTMVAVGVLYLGLSIYGVRSGLHWARLVIFVSAFTGFASFFLFLGFGYLDPFHAFVTAVLLQLLLLAVHSREATYRPRIAPALRGSAAWRCALWGQLFLIIHGCALVAAGLVISTIGVTRVFVPEDLAFMGTTAEALQSADPRLVPLIAHDRATMGGMLLSAGAAFLLIGLWGFRNGSAWLWWTLLAAGVPAYAAALAVHLVVGYTDFGHLLPAFTGLTLFLIGLGLSRSFLCSRSTADEALWRRFLSV